MSSPVFTPDELKAFIKQQWNEWETITDNYTEFGYVTRDVVLKNLRRHVDQAVLDAHVDACIAMNTIEGVRPPSVVAAFHQSQAIFEQAVLIGPREVDDVHKQDAAFEVSQKLQEIAEAAKKTRAKFTKDDITAIIIEVMGCMNESELFISEHTPNYHETGLNLARYIGQTIRKELEAPLQDEVNRTGIRFNLMTQIGGPGKSRDHTTMAEFEKLDAIIKRRMQEHFPDMAPQRSK